MNESGVTTNLPPVVRAAWVSVAPSIAFEVFTEEIGAWWPLPTHGLFGDRSGSVQFRDGRLVERAVDGRESVWAEVQAWDPPTGFTLCWHPGQSADEGSQVEVSFADENGGTRVLVEHRGWESFGRDGASRRHGYVGPNAWGYVLDFFANGAEPSPSPVDLGALQAAYGEFFTEAGSGEFGDAPEGEWNADQVIAHVALNDLSMLLVCQSLVHQRAAGFENQTSQDLEVLQQFIAVAGSRAELVAQGQSLARQVVASLRRLSPAQRQELVQCHLTHDGEVMVDQPLPWEAIAIETQAGRHLPAHVEQLQKLRLG